MGRALNYDFDFAFLKRNVYYPQGHEDDAVTGLKMRNALLKILEGEKPLPMQVVQSEVAAENGAALSKAWLDVAEGKKTLRIELTPPVVTAPEVTLRETPRI